LRVTFSIVKSPFSHDNSPALWRYGSVLLRVKSTLIFL